MIAGRGVPGLNGFMFLMWGLIFLLAKKLPLWASTNIVGSALGTLAGILGTIGKSQLQHTDRKPEQTFDSVKEDKETAGEVVSAVTDDRPRTRLGVARSSRLGLPCERRLKSAAGGDIHNPISCLALVALNCVTVTLKAWFRASDIEKSARRLMAQLASGARGASRDCLSQKMVLYSKCLMPPSATRRVIRERERGYSGGNTARATCSARLT